MRQRKAWKPFAAQAPDRVVPTSSESGYNGNALEEKHLSTDPSMAITKRLEAMLEEFKEFATRGNVVDLAIGVIIGAAFGKIVDSVVNDIFMPVIGAITGGLDFSNYFVPLTSAVTAPVLQEARKQGAVLAYGNFLTIAVNFLIVAFILFLVVKAINRLRQRQPPAPPPAPTRSEVLLEEIRDQLKRRSA
jgi:large conductance mechanosensitive channel